MNKLVIKRFIKNNKILLFVISSLSIFIIGLMISTILIAQKEKTQTNTYQKNIANYSKKNTSLQEENDELKLKADELEVSFSFLSKRLNKLILDSKKQKKETEDALKEILETDVLKDNEIRGLNKDSQELKMLLESTSQELSFFQTTLKERDSKILELQTKQNDIAEKALKRNNEEWEKIQTPAAKEVRKLKSDIDALKKEKIELKKSEQTYKEWWTTEVKEHEKTIQELKDLSDSKGEKEDRR